MMYHGGWVSANPNLIIKNPCPRQTSRGISAWCMSWVSINDISTKAGVEQDFPALQPPPELLGTVSEPGVYRHIAGTQYHEKKFAIHHNVFPRTSARIAYLPQEPFESRTGEANAAASPERYLACFARTSSLKQPRDAPRKW
jgi:hypothetical protein